jgi:hypothetical protein
VSEVSDLSKKELAVLSEVVDLFEQILDKLGAVEAWPRDHVLHIESEVQPGYLGWIGWNEGGAVTFQPAPAAAADDAGVSR